MVEMFNKYPNWTLRPGVIIHANLHCVANKMPNPNTLRYLVETTKGKRRLFRDEDEKKGNFHEWRKGGRKNPEISDIPDTVKKHLKDVKEIDVEEIFEWYKKYKK